MGKITSETDLGVTRDHLPLQYKYTAGVAGDRFFQLLKQGKLQASHCRNCNKLYLPAKIFCKECFAQLDDWRDIDENTGYVYSFTEVKGKEGKSDLIALIKFQGVEGGILGKLKSSREEPRIGMKVKPIFRTKDARVGDLSDIEYFEKS